MGSDQEEIELLVSNYNSLMATVENIVPLARPCDSCPLVVKIATSQPFTPKEQELCQMYEFFINAMQALNPKLNKRQTLSCGGNFVLATPPELR